MALGQAANDLRKHGISGGKLSLIPTSAGRIGHLACALALLLAISTACKEPTPRADKNKQDKVTAEQMKSDIRRAADTTGKYLSQESQEYSQKARRELEELSAKAQRMRDDIESTTGTAHKEAARLAREFDAKVKTAKAKIEDLKKSPAWETGKKNLDQTMDDLRGSLKDLQARLRNRPGKEAPATPTATPAQEP